MTSPARYPQGSGSQKPVVNAGRLWGGGIATSLIAGGVALVSLFGAEGVFDVDVLVPTSPGADTYEALDGGPTFLVAFVAGLVATGLLHLLLVYAPRPLLFFQWGGVVVIAAALLYPFTLALAQSSEVALAAIHGLTGIAIISMLSGIVSWVSSPPARA